MNLESGFLFLSRLFILFFISWLLAVFPSRFYPFPHPPRVGGQDAFVAHGIGEVAPGELVPAFALGGDMFDGVHTIRLLCLTAAWVGILAAPVLSQ